MNVGGLVRRIEDARSCIKELETAVTEQRKIISDYRIHIEEGVRYSKEALERGIVSAEQAIVMLNGSISDQRQIVANSRRQLDTLEREDARKKEAEAGIHIEVVHES